MSGIGWLDPQSPDADVIRIMVQVHRGELTPDAEKRLLVLADNRIALSAGWDRDLLASELGDLAELLP